MKEHPILFSGPMVRALLAGTKTQTRRVVKPQPTHFNPVGVPRLARPEGPSDMIRCPYGQLGDRLWVRETWMDLLGTGIERKTGDHGRYAYAADTPPGSYGDDQRKAYGLKWRPSIHMPRWASRITLEITGVRVERLQDISEADAIAEGCYVAPRLGTRQDYQQEVADARYATRRAYRDLWEQINGHGSWDANPWVWVVEFRDMKGSAS